MNPRRRRHQRLRKHTPTHTLRDQFLHMISQAEDAPNYKEAITAAVKWAAGFVQLGHLVKSFQKVFQIPNVALMGLNKDSFSGISEEMTGEEKYLEFIAKVPVPESSALATSSE